METNQAITEVDLHYMRQAIQLAKRGAGWVQTNPMVGSILVHHHKIIAQNYHAKFGGPHAERQVLESAIKKFSKKILAQSTLYITLEPCSRTNKKTPPCLPLVLESGVKRVVIGSMDPHAGEQGKSVRKLRTAGIQVTVGVAKLECDYLIRTFIKWAKTGQPFVLAKTALSLDGKITAPRQKYLSNKLALQRVHELRQEFAVIAVGANTVLKDSPKLTTRLAKTKLHQPIKVIFDHHLIIPANHPTLDKRTILFCAPTASLTKLHRLQRKGITVIPYQTLPEALEWLAEHDIASILVEGGASLLTSFINQQMIDEFYLLYTPQIFGLDQLNYCGTLNHAVQFVQPVVEPLGDNILIRGYAKYS